MVKILWRSNKDKVTLRWLKSIGMVSQKLYRNTLKPWVSRALIRVECETGTLKATSRNKHSKAMKRDKSPAEQGQYTSICFVLSSIHKARQKRCKARTAHIYISRSLNHETEQEPSKWVYTPPSLGYEGNNRAKREASTRTGKNTLPAKQRPPKLTHVAAICFYQRLAEWGILHLERACFGLARCRTRNILHLERACFGLWLKAGWKKKKKKNPGPRRSEMQSERKEKTRRR